VQDEVQSGAIAARRWAEQNIPGCAEALSAEYAGRDADGKTLSEIASFARSVLP